MARFNPVEHQFARFLRMPLSLRKAMAVIVTATVVSVGIGGVVINIVDGQEFPGIGTGLWWALQTVTTVGYGDVTPQNTGGRLVGAVLMLESTALIAIVTAAIAGGRRRPGTNGSDPAGHGAGLCGGRPGTRARVGR